MDPIWTLAARGPHAGAPVYAHGAPLETARGAVILLHGRGATAASILALADALEVEDMAWLAPQAADSQWYPNRFLAPLDSNEPWLSGALAAVDDVRSRVVSAGIDETRLSLLGFSQGACLAHEYAVRHPRRYGAVIGLSGGLIGPPGTTWPAPQALAGTTVFLGCGDQDHHIPVARVEESADVFRRAGAVVTARIYPGMPHTVNDDEIETVRVMLQEMC